MIPLQHLYKPLRLVIGAALAAILLTLVVSIAASANTANILKVSPLRTDVEILPGESKEVETIVSNLTGGPITVRPIVNDFVAGDERGTPALILNENDFAPTRSLKRFVAPMADIEIPAGEAKTVRTLVSVPAGTQAGGYFGAIRFAPTTPDSGGQVNLSASVASLVLLTVPGDIVEKLELTDFDIMQAGVPGTFFNTPNDIAATVRFESKGNTQLGPFGKIAIKNGDEIVYEADFNGNTPRDMILPDSARRWDIPLDKIGDFGLYTVTATFTYGKTNQTLEVGKTFWVVPVWMIITAAAVLGVLIIALVVGIWLAVRRHNNRGYRSSRIRTRR